MANYQNRNILANYTSRYYRGVMKRIINIIENLTTHAKIWLENAANKRDIQFLALYASINVDNVYIGAVFIV